MGTLLEHHEGRVKTGTRGTHTHTHTHAHFGTRHVTDFKQARLRCEYFRRHRNKEKKSSTHSNRQNLRAGTAQKLLSQN